MVGIYKIVSPNGSIYIGKSVNIKKRWQRYKRLDCKSQIKLYRSFIKYGVDSHNFQVIMELPIDVDKSIILEMEKAILDIFLDTGISILNTILPDQDKEYINRVALGVSKSSKGIPKSEAHKQALKDYWSTHPRTEKHREGLSRARKGKTFTKEQILRKYNNCPTKIRINVVNIQDNNVIASISSIKEATRVLPILGINIKWANTIRTYLKESRLYNNMYKLEYAI